MNIDKNLLDLIYLGLGVFGVFFLIGIIISIFCIVRTQQVWIIERFGKFSRMQKAGLNFKIPLIERVAGKISLKVNQLDVKAETKTQDNVFVNISVSVQYYIEESSVYTAFYKLSNPENQMKAYIYDVIRGYLPTKTLDESFETKDEAAQKIKDELVKGIQDFGYQIITVLVTDIEPETSVKKSMNEINSAQRQLEATKATAEADKLILVKAAEAEKEKMKLLGEGMAEQRKAIADGISESIEKIKYTANGSLTEAEVSELMLQYEKFSTYENMAKSGKSNIIFMNTEDNKICNEMVKADFISKKMEN